MAALVILGLLAVCDAFRVLQSPHFRYPLRMTSPHRLSMQASTVDLSQIGADIEIPRADKVVKIIMKFGGSSLANAERVTYVARLIQKHVESG